MSKKKKNQNKKKIQFLIYAILLVAGLILSLMPDVEQTPESTVITVPAGDAPVADAGVAERLPGELLSVHYLDVGQADAFLLEYGGEYVLIDGGNRDDGEYVISYLQAEGVEELEAVVCTHAHEDHVGGLPAVLAVYPTKAVYAPTNTYSSKVFDDFLYYIDQQRLELTIPQPGDKLRLGAVELMVLGPVQSYADPNDTSIVLRVAHGDNVFLFTGDMERGAEVDMLDYWGVESGIFEADVLKVGHHGSDTSTGYRFLREVNPTYGVIPVGAGNDYGHPHEEPMARLNQAGVVLLRTDELGTIIARSDGSEITFTWENQNKSPANAEPAQPVQYIGSKKSATVHAPDCGSLPGQQNRVYYDTYEDAIAAGCKPCQGCLG